MKEDSPAPIERPLRTPEEYRTMLDPHAELPKVVLRETSGSDGVGTRTFIIGNDAGGAVGNLILNIDKDGKKANVTYITVFEGEKGEKYAKSAYLELIVFLAGMGARLDSRHSMNRAVYAIWNWLVDTGAARLVKDNGVSTSTHNLHYSTSIYEII